MVSLSRQDRDSRNSSDGGQYLNKTAASRTKVNGMRQDAPGRSIASWKQPVRGSRATPWAILWLAASSAKAFARADGGWSIRSMVHSGSTPSGASLRETCLGPGSRGANAERSRRDPSQAMDGQAFGRLEPAWTGVGRPFALLVPHRAGAVDSRLTGMEHNGGSYDEAGRVVAERRGRRGQMRA
ncbi:hypothetical protein BGZ61DRAFT_552937 [Ilyonectria robusta]|uniref:uncharacterized protein n=1 Tax=Ilyonectria robusta TaxID=1079257 RepID=UPI001E8E5D05|nr:uncharacterized protein BGZ61DRAFT_552937 [Ilyonectria robusta]KAH8735448.1 hypothetical protein BGZ61DRAFT_552937 [Ilyonectria robusta]